MPVRIVARLLQTPPLLEKELTERRKAVVALPAPAAGRDKGHRRRRRPSLRPSSRFSPGRGNLHRPPPARPAIFAEPHDLGGALRDNPVRRAQIEEQDRARTENQAAAFERQVPTARVVRLPHASHFVFESNEADVPAGDAGFHRPPARTLISPPGRGPIGKSPGAGSGKSLGRTV